MKEKQGVKMVLGKNIKKQFKKMSPRILVIMILVTSIIVASFSISRYETILDGDDISTVALVTLNKSQDIEISLDGNDFFPGSTYIYEFGITNNDNGKILETKMNYTITINDLGNIPLEYTLENVSVSGNGVAIEDKTLTKGLATSAGIMPLTSDTHTYKLYIHWNEENNDENYSKLLENIKISIDAEQID
jgi:hypothetical protein